MRVPVELLERSVQLKDADQLLHALATGSGRLVLVEGPPGIGKTAYIGAVAACAASLQLQVLRARAAELEQGFAYGVVRQLFERRLAAEPADGRSDLLAGAAGLAAPLVTPTAHAPEPEAQYALLHGLYWLTANLARRCPLLLIVDDAQWADLPSLQFLDYLLRRLDGMPVGALLATRSTTSTPQLGALAIEPSVSLIHLPPLSHAAVAELVTASFGPTVDTALSAACERVTGGNPFLVRELLDWLASVDSTQRSAALESSAPPTVRASVQHRLDRLSSAAQRLARASAILDADAGTGRTAELADLTLDESMAAADELEAAMIFAPRVLQFRHVLLRVAVLDALSTVDRTRLHRRAARLLLEDGVDPSVVAHHLVEIDPVGEAWVVEVLVQAARQALRHADPSTAASWLRRALAEPLAFEERARVLRDLGIAEQRLGDPAADEHLRQAFALSEDPVERGQTLRAVLLQFLTTGRGEEVLTMLDATLPELAARDSDLAERLEAEVLSAARHALTASLWLADRLRSWRNRADPYRPGGRLLLANLATQSALDGGSADATAALARLALADGRLLHDQTADAMPVYQAIWQLTAAEQLTEAEEALALAHADAQRRGSIVGFALASLFHSYLELARGNVPAAEADAVSALDAAHHADERWFGTPAVVAALVDVYIERGRLSAAERLIAEHGWSSELADTVPLRLLLHSRGQLRLALGQPHAALRDFLEHVGREQQLQALSTHLAPSPAGAALALAATGELAAARVHAAQALDAARAWGAPRVVARGLRVQANLEAPDAAASTLDQAVRLLQRSPARVDEAWARVELGKVLVRLGRRGDGARELRAALDLGYRAHAGGVTEAARTALLSSGYRPRRAAATGVDALTGAERRVVELAARGQSNRSIAQSLFVTERTVELHLTNAYRKLEVSTRRDLASALEGGSSKS